MIRPMNSMVHLNLVEERHVPGGAGSWVHPVWERQFPWLVQGVTGPARGGKENAVDFGLFTESPALGANEAWDRLAGTTGLGRMAHSRQIHGNRVHVHRLEDWGHSDRLRIVQDGDGHLTGEPGILMGVVAADCVPAFLVDPMGPRVGVVHAGWRGVAAGILPTAIGAMKRHFGSEPHDLLLHLGPSICGECYEVGEAVFRQLNLPYPGRPSPVDLRRYLAGQALREGVPNAAITCSAWCTACGESPFFSHRGGERGRHVGFVGLRPR